MLSAVRKNGRIVSPATDASSSTKAEKSIAVMLRPRRRQSTYRRPARPATVAPSVCGGARRRSTLGARFGTIALRNTGAAAACWPSSLNGHLQPPLRHSGLGYRIDWLDYSGVVLAFCIGGRSPMPRKEVHRGWGPLIFVRCGVCCCGAGAPRVPAALLGLFLPRLGPLAIASGPFLSASRIRGYSAAAR